MLMLIATKQHNPEQFWNLAIQIRIPKPNAKTLKLNGEDDNIMKSEKN